MATEPLRQNQTGAGREKLRQASQLAGEAATETATHLRERARSSVQTGKKRASDMADKAQAQIKQHPALSVGCAFLAGWVIARLMK